MNAPIKYLKAGMDTPKGVQRRNNEEGKGGRVEGWKNKFKRREYSLGKARGGSRFAANGTCFPGLGGARSVMRRIVDMSFGPGDAGEFTRGEGHSWQCHKPHAKWMEGLHSMGA